MNKIFKWFISSAFLIVAVIYLSGCSSGGGGSSSNNANTDVQLSGTVQVQGGSNQNSGQQ